MRGGSQAAAKPRAKKAPSTGKRPSAQAQGGYVHAKLRAAGRVGLAPHHALMAACALLGVALVIAMATGGRAQKISRAVDVAVGSRFATVGFKLKAVKVEGASALATPDILRAAGLYKDQPLLGMDMEALRRRLEAVGWVKEARVVRLLPDRLVLQVIERKPLAVWQHGGSSRVIDDHGRVIPEAHPDNFAALPLIVGEGADDDAAAILTVLSGRPRLMVRLEALVRVDDRRWDLRLKDGSLIQLPATGESEALAQLEQLDAKSRILDIGFARIDLRDPSLAVVRPRDVTSPSGILADGV